jgi:hypothetical protein
VEQNLRLEYQSTNTPHLFSSLKHLTLLHEVVLKDIKNRIVENTKNGTLSFADEVSLDWQIFIQKYLVLFL